MAFQQLAIEFGILIQYLVQYGASFIDNGQSPLNFRIPWAVQILPALILLIGMVTLLPWSPRWLVSNGRFKDALVVLGDVHGRGNMLDPVVVAQYEEMVADYVRERTTRTKFTDLFKGTNRHRLVLGVSMQYLNQLGGINALMYYITYIVQAGGLSGRVATLTASLVQYVCFLIGTGIAVIFNDAWGRRPTAIWGAFLEGCCIFIVGILQATLGTSVPEAGNSTVVWIIRDNRTATYFVLIFSYLFVFFNGLLWGPTSWCLPAENPSESEATRLPSARRVIGSPTLLLGTLRRQPSITSSGRRI